TLEHGTPQTIAVARRPRRRVHRTVALDAEQVLAGALGVQHRDVESVGRAADIALDAVPARLERARDLVPEQSDARPTARRRVLARVGLRTPLRVLEKESQVACAVRLRPPEVDVVGAQAGEDDGLAAGARDRDVEAAFAAAAVERPEVEVHAPLLVGPVADG